MARRKSNQNKDQDKDDSSSKTPYDDILGTVDDLKVYLEKVSTGSIKLDIYLGGGFRCGMSRFIGEPEHGKTAQALTWGKNWQSTIKNGVVIYVNAEGRLSPELIALTGINTDPKKFIIVQTNIYEKVCNYIKDKIRDNDKKERFFIVIDSTDALVRKGDQDKDFDDPEKVAGGALMSSSFMRRMSPIISRFGHHLQVLSQTRVKMNSQMGADGQGKSTVGASGTSASGGKALEFYSSLTGKIRKMWKKSYFFAPEDKEETKPIGQKFDVDIIKSFNEKKNRRLEIPIKYGRGVWTEKEVFDLLIAKNDIEKKGSWYAITNQRLLDDMKRDLNDENFKEKHQGEYGWYRYLEENPKYTNYLVEYVKEFWMTNDEVQSQVEEQDISEIFESEEV